MAERNEVAALGAIVAALAIVALGQRGLPADEHARPAGNGRGAAPASVQPADRARPAADALIALREGRTIDLNCADAATLELLPGVGPALSQRIVEHRIAAGPFPDVDALDLVRGVGPKTLERMRPLLSVGVSTCPTSRTPTR